MTDKPASKHASILALASGLVKLMDEDPLLESVSDDLKVAALRVASEAVSQKISNDIQMALLAKTMRRD